MDRVRQSFLEACDEMPSDPRSQAIIATSDGIPIGWVRRYGESRFPDSWSIGIGIGEDDRLGQGYGSAALKLWIDYLFRTSTIHRLALATYSFNQRMLRVAEKVGFRHEGTERGLVHWDGHWQDRVRYAMLRHEWEMMTGA
jgi:RimJ/RimL family protein N-acetyltransferase